jgi:hypothetical protein
MAALDQSQRHFRQILPCGHYVRMKGLIDEQEAH